MKQLVGMDVSGRRRSNGTIRRFCRARWRYLISSHISEDIEQLADKLVFMKDGRMILTEQKDIPFSTIWNCYDRR